MGEISLDIHINTFSLFAVIIHTVTTNRKIVNNELEFFRQIQGLGFCELPVTHFLSTFNI